MPGKPFRHTQGRELCRTAPACPSRPDGMAGELDLIIKSDYPVRKKMKNQSDPEGVLTKLFGSVSRARILALLISRAGQQLYQREIM